MSERSVQIMVAQGGSHQPINNLQFEWGSTALDDQRDQMYTQSHFQIFVPIYAIPIVFMSLPIPTKLEKNSIWVAILTLKIMKFE